MINTELLKNRIPPFFSVTAVEQTDSTNRVVKEWGAHGCPQGAVLVAHAQTHGRGRLGRSFYSPKGGLYFSILLRPTLSATDTLRLTTAMGVAVAESLGEDAQIKWVNDVFLRGKKVCGILTESVFRGDDLAFAVVGVGINLVAPQDGFPTELQSVAGGVYQAPPTSEQVADLLQAILTRFYEYYQNLFDPRIFTAYRNRQLLSGKTVIVGQVTGVVIDLTQDFALLVQDKEGKLHTIAAGEVTLGSKACKEAAKC